MNDSFWLEVVDPPVAEFCTRLMFALLHFVWQGAIAAIVVSVAGHVLRHRSAAVRYSVSLTAMFSLPLCFAATFYMVGPADFGSEIENQFNAVVWDEGPTAVGADGFGQPSTLASAESDGQEPAGEMLATMALGDGGNTNDGKADGDGQLKSNVAGTQPAESVGQLFNEGGETQSSPVGQGSAPLDWSSHMTALSPVLVLVYLIGVAGMLCRLVVAVWGGRKLRLSAVAVTNERLVEVVASLSRQMRLSAVPAIAICNRIAVPMVVGIVKPVVLVPATLLTGLDDVQLKAVLCHELAHIRRHDLLLNLLQRVIEAVFFFHPAVWFISRHVSSEREACCDDVAVLTGCGKTLYAGALIRVAELCVLNGRTGFQPQLAALRASGSSSSELAGRIRRLLGGDQVPRPGNVRLLMAAGLAIAAGFALYMAWPGFAETDGAAEASEELNVGDSDANDVPLERPTLPTWNHFPEWGGGSLRNHVTACRDLPTSLDVAGQSNVLWTARLGETVYNTPVVAGGRVFIGTSNAGYIERYPEAETDLGTLLCFDEVTGDFLWQYSALKRLETPPFVRNYVDLPQQGICSAPCVDDDRLWVVNNRAEVVCLDVEGFRDGENDGPVQDEESDADNEADVIWRFDMFEELGVRTHFVTSTSPTIVGDLILVGTSHGIDAPGTNGKDWPEANPNAPSFIAFNRHSGEVVWQDNSPGANILDGQWSSPAFAVIEGIPQAIFAGGDGWLYSFDVRDIRKGKSNLLWKFDCNPKTSKYLVGGGRGSRNSIVATPVIVGSRVYIASGRNPENGDGAGIVWCIDATKRGDISETLVFSKYSPSAPLQPRRFQNCDPEQGEFESSNSESGVVWKYTGADLDGDGKIEPDESMYRATSSVTVSDGLAVIGDYSGYLHCIDADTGAGLWIYDTLANMGGTPLINEDRIYTADEDGELLVLSLAREFQGVEEFSMEYPVSGSLVAANDRLFVAQKKQLMVISNEKARLSLDAEPAPTQWRGFYEDGSAVAVQSEFDLHFILYSEGLMHSNLEGVFYTDGFWSHKGQVWLDSDEGDVRSFNVKSDSRSVDSISIDGERLKLDEGRLLVLRPEGDVVQLECGSQIESRADIQQMASFVRQSLAEQAAADDEGE